MIQSIIEKMLMQVNTSLYQDPSLVSMLEPWFGHFLSISVQGVRHTIWLQVTESRIIYIAHPEVVVNATMIHAAPSVWLTVMRGRGKQQNTIPEGMHIAGDVGFAIALFRTLSRLEIDWLSPFSESWGAMPTLGVKQFTDTINGWMQQAKKAHNENVAGFLQDETVHLPTRAMMQQFSNEVTELRHRAERLHVRYKRLRQSA